MHGFGLPQAHSVPHMFGNCLYGISKGIKPLVLLGAVVTSWFARAIVSSKENHFSVADVVLSYQLDPFMDYTTQTTL